MRWRKDGADGSDQRALASVSEGQRNRRFLTQLASVGAARVLPQAKQALIDSGMDPQRVAQMPTGQVVAIQASRAYRHIYHENMKWFYVPFWQARRSRRRRSSGSRQKVIWGNGFPARRSFRSRA